MRCAFCELPEIKERSIIENELAVAFLTNIPITIGHTLVIPKRCVAKLEELEANELAAILDLVAQIKSALIETYGAEGFNIARNENKVAGQSVPHFHLHVVPRKEGDSGVYNYEPRVFLYRPGSREVSEEAELVATTEEIKKNVK